MKTIGPSLASTPCFMTLDPCHLEVLDENASYERFEPGDFLFHEGEEADRFYVIREGRVAIKAFDGEHGPVTVQLLGPGDIMGWSWLIPPHHWRFDARAVERTEAIALDGQALRMRCEEDHDLGYDLLMRFSYILSQRLELTRMKLLERCDLA